jgi:hypothetical protein
MAQKKDFEKRRDVFLEEVNKLVKKYEVTFGTELEYRVNGIIGKLILKDIKKYDDIKTAS